MLPPRQGHFLGGGSFLGRGSFRLRGRRLAADEPLLLDLLELDREAGDQRTEPAYDAGDRRGDEAGELRDHRVAARELCERLEVLDRDGGAVHRAALELKHLVLLAEVGDRLCGQRGIAADERERRRALEQLLEGVDARLVGRADRQAILDDSKARVGLAQLLAQVGDLGDRDSAVVNREHGL